MSVTRTLSVHTPHTAHMSTLWQASRHMWALTAQPSQALHGYLHLSQLRGHRVGCQPWHWGRGGVEHVLSRSSPHYQVTGGGPGRTPAKPNLLNLFSLGITNLYSMEKKCIFLTTLTSVMSKDLATSLPCSLKIRPVEPITR